MAIEKMTKLDIIGYKEDLNKVCRSIVLSKVLHPMDAMEEINDLRFSQNEGNDEDGVDISYLKLYSRQINYSDAEKIIKNLRKKCIFSDKPVLKDEELILDYDELMIKINEIDNKFLPVYTELDNLNKKKEDIEKHIKNFSWLKRINIPVENVLNLKNFYFEIYKISRENMLKLKSNYENIPSVIINGFSNKEYNLIMCFTPVDLKVEADKILKSLNSESVALPEGFSGTPFEVIKSLIKQRREVKQHIKILTEKLKSISEDNARTVYMLEKSLELEMKASILKSRAVYTNDFFYLSGWIPESLINNFSREINSLEDNLIIVSRSADEIQHSKLVPPTRLKNNFLVKPFEAMVGMYGTPTYGEMDPTTFFGISYMILFGAMFGDLGQGLILLALGLLLKYKMGRSNLGGVIGRLGISSSLFGVAYGSFFGFENVIPALIIRPMENIMNVLLYAVIFGCGLLIFGFACSIINGVKKKDMENGLFGKTGAAGLAFYIGLLVFVYTKVKNISTIPDLIWILIFIILFAIILLKQPIANLLSGKKPLFLEKRSDYFIEGGFGFVELLLSMLSNTISFIRVGAFALNHVGLFMAFETLARMTHSSVGSGVMYILGNLVIIGLEGLIVFIQSLRLEYYELFSKYYSGSGTAFEPVKLSEDIKTIRDQSFLRSDNKKIVFEK